MADCFPIKYLIFYTYQILPLNDIICFLLGELLCAVTHTDEWIPRLCCPGKCFLTLISSTKFWTKRLNIFCVLYKPAASKKFGRQISTCLKVMDMTGLKLSALSQIKVSSQSSPPLTKLCGDLNDKLYCISDLNLEESNLLFDDSCGFQPYCHARNWQA